MAAYWRHLAAAWAIVCGLAALMAGGFALVPGVDTAQATPALRSLDGSRGVLPVARISTEAIEVDD